MHSEGLSPPKAGLDICCCLGLFGLFPQRGSSWWHLCPGGHPWSPIRAPKEMWNKGRIRQKPLDTKPQNDVTDHLPPSESHHTSRICICLTVHPLRHHSPLWMWEQWQCPGPCSSPGTGHPLLPPDTSSPLSLAHQVCQVWFKPMLTAPRHLLHTQEHAPGFSQTPSKPGAPPSADLLDFWE